MEQIKTLAEKLHEGYYAKIKIEDKILELFKKYESEIYDNDFDFDIGSDDYDNSIEVYIKNIIPYPYEPCQEIRKGILDLGFSVVYWNFIDENGKYTEEIRGNEPRRYKNFQHIHIDGVGYVDDRYKK